MAPAVNLYGANYGVVRTPTPKNTVKCFVYKGNRKADTFLYLLKQDDFEDIPDSLLKLMGDLEFVLSFDINQRQRLANADIATVTELLNSQGYYVQLPPQTIVTKN